MKKHINRIRFFLLIFNFLFLPGIIHAEKGNDFNGSPKTVRSFDKKSIKHFRSLEEYNYEPVVYNSDSNSIWGLIGRFFARLFSNTGEGTSLLMKYLLYIVTGGLIIYFLLKLAKADISWFLYSKANNPTIQISEVDENIHDIDLRKIIDEAVSNKDFRKAIRFSYLLILKELTDKALIDWKPEKTNAEYQRELMSSDLKPLFEENTLVYEYIWYGNFSIEESEFQKTRHAFESFIQKIKGIK